MKQIVLCTSMCDTILVVQRQMLLLFLTAELGSRVLRKAIYLAAVKQAEQMNVTAPEDTPFAKFMQEEAKNNPTGLSGQNSNFETKYRTYNHLNLIHFHLL